MADETWAVAVSGDWANNTSWTPAVVPNVGDSVTVDVGSAAYTATLESSGSYSVDALSLDASTGTLEIAGTLALTGGLVNTLTVTAGELLIDATGIILDGTILSQGGAVVLGGGTFDAVTFQGDLSFTDNESLDVTNGLAVLSLGGETTGEIDLTGLNDHLTYLDADTLDNVSLNIGNAAGADFVDSTGGVVTLGTNFVLTQMTGLAVLDGSFTNEGSFNASGGMLTVENFSSDTFSNGGAINLGAGEIFIVTTSTFYNSGLVYIGNSSIVLDEATTFDSTGTLEVAGTLALTGGLVNTLTLTAGELLIDATGSIQGGTILSAGGAVALTGGTFDDVTYQGDLSFTDNQSLNVTNGLTVEQTGGGAPGEIDLTALNDHLTYLDADTLDNVNLNIGNAAGADFLDSTGGVVTLGTDFVLTQTGGFAVLDGSFTNEGSFNASGGILTVENFSSDTFSNAGAINLGEGENLVVETTDFDNSGLVDIGNGSGALIEATAFDSSGTIKIENGGSLEIDSSTSANITFAPEGAPPVGATLKIDDPFAQPFTGELTNITFGDTIELGGVVLQSATIVGNTLTIVTDDGTLNYALANPSAGVDAFVTADQSQVIISDHDQTVPTVAAGTDYVQTTGGTQFDFQGMFGLGVVDLESDPVGPGQTDTKIERLQDATIGGPAVPLQVETISLKSTDTVNIGGDSFEVYAYLDPNKLSADTGTMNIDGSLSGGTFNNQFTVDLALRFQDLTNPHRTFVLSSANNHDQVLLFTATGTWTPEQPGGVVSVAAWDDGSHLDHAANVHYGLDPKEVDFFFTGAVEHTTGGGNDIHVVQPAPVCFATGTHILTNVGEVPVEDLKPGDIVITLASGYRAPAPVKWIGRRRIDLTRHAEPTLAAPIRIRRGALAENVPHRDLLLSPDHAIYTEGVLVCARLLVNGATIAPDSECTAVEYFHVELDHHAILFAEGLKAESYLDTGNRGFFANSDEPQVLHPDLSSETGQEARQAGSCAPLVDDPETVRTIWQILADRADNLGISRPVAATTNEPDIAVLANGRRLRPIRQPDRGSAMFCLPPGLATLRLLSRATAPCATRPWIEDRRTLGVAVSRIVMRDQETLREIPLDHPTLADGWWAVERDDAAMWRWTDGDAELPLPAAGRACLLEIRIQCGGIYLLDARAVHLRAAA